MAAFRSVLLLLGRLGLFIAQVRSFDPYNPDDAPSVYPTDSLVEQGSAFPFANQFPSDRTLQTLVATSNYLLVYGGMARNGSYLGDINLYHLPSQRWSGPIVRKECCNELDEVVDLIGLSNRVKDAHNITFLMEGANGDFPLPRAEHAACAIDDLMILYGGQSSLSKRPGQLLGDLWAFDPVELHWSAIETVEIFVGATPSRRAGHILIPHPRGCILFGGRVAGNISSVVGSNEVWLWDHEPRNWVRLDQPPKSRFNAAATTAALYVPAPRQYSAGTRIGEKIYVFGGSDPASGRLYGDLWVFDLTSREWTQLADETQTAIGGVSSVGFGYSYCPPPLALAHMLPSPDNCDDNGDEKDGCGESASLLLYGGLGSGGLCLDPLLSTPSTILATSSCGMPQTALGQVYRFSLANASWPPPLQNPLHPLPDRTGHWISARLGDGRSADEAEGGGSRRRKKEYAFEAVVFDQKHKLIYEVGGVKSDLQEGSHSVGGRIASSLSDTMTGEGLVDVVMLPVSAAWTLGQALFNGSLLGLRNDDYYEKEGSDRRVLKFESKLRVFSVAASDITLLTESSGSGA